MAPQTRLEVQLGSGSDAVRHLGPAMVAAPHATINIVHWASAGKKHGKGIRLMYSVAPFAVLVNQHNENAKRMQAGRWRAKLSVLAACMSRSFRQACSGRDVLRKRRSLVERLRSGECACCDSTALRSV